MRKTNPTVAKVRGNAAKYESYKEAWARIAAAREAGFYLEAVVIEESLISDRLISHLTRPGCPKSIAKNKWGQWPPFASLILDWQREFPAGLAVNGFPNLCAAVDTWRAARNKAVHAIAKSDPGTATVDVEEFLRLAKLAAADGARLARAICAWYQTTKQERPKGSLNKS